MGTLLRLLAPNSEQHPGCAEILFIHLGQALLIGTAPVLCSRELHLHDQRFDELKHHLAIIRKALLSLSTGRKLDKVGHLALNGEARLAKKRREHLHS